MQAATFSAVWHASCNGAVPGSLPLAFGLSGAHHMGRLALTRQATPTEGRAAALRALREEVFARQVATNVDLTPITEGDLLLNTVVFIASSVPFLYAAWEFWRRIAFGQPFGTGTDPVVFPKPGEEDPLIIKEAPSRTVGPLGKDGKLTIGMDADTNRGRRVLGQDALLFAYLLMFLAAASVAVAGVAVYPVLISQAPTLAR